MVTMSSKITFGTTTADWQERINVERMRQQRAERARQIMRKNGVPTLLVSSPADVRYLTGCVGASWEPQLYYVLFFADHDPVVYQHAGDHLQQPDQAPWIKNFRCARSWLGGTVGPEASRDEAKMFAVEILDELRQRGLAKEKVGIFGFDGYAIDALTEAGITLVNAVPMISEMKTIKLIDEINCLKTVAAIAEAAWWRVWEALRPGMRDTELLRAAVDGALEAGAESVVTQNAPLSGPLSFPRGIRGTNRIIQTGDLVYMPLCHISYLGYCSCTYRTLITGRKPNDKEKDWYKKLLDRMNNIIDAIKPGATTADAAKHFAPASTWGYKDEVEVLTVEIGHGIGIGGYNLPVINRQFSLKHPQVIEPGMAIAIESMEGEFRVGGVRLEDMVIVTENGAELIDHMPREQIWPPKFGF
jgi:Xaa-Pro dipeptidase